MARRTGARSSSSQSADSHSNDSDALDRTKLKNLFKSDKLGRGELASDFDEE